MVIWKQKKQLKAGFPIPEYLTGKDLIAHFKISYLQLMYHVYNGNLPAYPADTDVYHVGSDSVPMSREDLLFLLSSGLELETRVNSLWFRKKDIDYYIIKKPE